MSDEAALARARELVARFKDRPLELRRSWTGNGRVYARDIARAGEPVIAPTRAGGDLQLDAVEWDLLREAPDLLAALLRRLELHEPPQHDCWRCHDEWVATLAPRDERAFWVGMLLCETCGHKRCPHATDHRLACTGSNAPGQSGSRYA